ncbi:DUF3284 domain-containing protein [Breznakia pachnodae]|uniref:DUF3284 domain-containing protein n=1 Tax=Breznakia pachnodae TaxID=265178 RepID=A0ABU0DZY6_9FIRM|nr:DUF3284 domain-containing protein [Breznakia pachnodae]MDQ0360213.1 hypothetical protein [Breznakia pachnodae]
MEFTIELPVSANELFTCLNQSIIDDIFTYIGKKTKIEEIKEGFSYKKNISSNSQKPEYAYVTLTDYQPYKTYTVLYESNKRKTKVQYKVKEIEESKIEILYSEELEKLVKDDKGEQIFMKVENDNKGKVPLFKRIQFRQVIKTIKKKRQTA